jgi:hypothetical protein
LPAKYEDAAIYYEVSDNRSGKTDSAAVTPVPKNGVRTKLSEDFRNVASLSALLKKMTRIVKISSISLLKRSRTFALGERLENTKT